MELARTSPGLTIVSTTYHTMETAPNSNVENPGDRYLGWMSAKRLGKALCTAIESDDRAAGRIVVWVEDEAEVSTQMMSSLSQGEPRTLFPSAPRTSSELLVRKAGSWNACAAMETIT